MAKKHFIKGHFSLVEIPEISEEKVQKEIDDNLKKYQIVVNKANELGIECSVGYNEKENYIAFQFATAEKTKGSVNAKFKLLKDELKEHFPKSSCKVKGEGTTI